MLIDDVSKLRYVVGREWNVWTELLSGLFLSRVLIAEITKRGSVVGVSRIDELNCLTQTHCFVVFSSIMSPSEDLLLEVSRIDEKDFGYGSNYYYCTGASSTASSACLNHAI